MERFKLSECCPPLGSQLGAEIIFDTEGRLIYDLYAEFSPVSSTIPEGDSCALLIRADSGGWPTDPRKPWAPDICNGCRRRVVSKREKKSQTETPTLPSDQTPLEQ